MPLYEYELCEGDCKVCGGKFTLRRPLSGRHWTMDKQPPAACWQRIERLILASAVESAEEMPNDTGDASH